MVHNCSACVRCYSVICEDDLTRESAVGTVCASCKKVIEKQAVETFGVSAEEAVREMRFRIHQDTCLTASAGELCSCDHCCYCKWLALLCYTR